MQHRGQGEIVPLHKKVPADPSTYTFSYQRDTYVIDSVSPLIFARLPYPSSSHPPLSTFLSPKGLSSAQVEESTSLYGKNEFNIPIPSFSELFAEHATAPFFVFQIFCVGLWCLDEYWYYSLFTLFMLVVFECTVVWQVSMYCVFCLSRAHTISYPKRLRTLTEFRTMAVAPYPIQCVRDGKWVSIQSDGLVPGDVVSVGEYRIVLMISVY